MGTRGPKKTPTNILKLRGSRRADDRSKNEPKPVQGMPEPPKWLKGEGLAEWHRKAQLLYDQGTLSLVDDAVFAAYCRTYQMVVEVDELLQDEEYKSLIVKRKNDSLARNPLVDILDKSVERLRRLASEFGMTPSGRTGINVPDKIERRTSAQKWLAKQKKA